MKVLSLHFKALDYGGLSGEKKAFSFLYSIYKLFIVFLLFWYTLSHLIRYVTSGNTDEEAKNGLFISAPYIAICMKILNYVVCAKEVINLREKFNEKIGQPVSEGECNIFQAYNQESNLLFWRILIFTMMCGTSVLIAPVMNKSLRDYELPLVTYQPYPISNWAFYYFTYGWQVVGSYYGILIQVTSDTMMYGFISLICAEYDILCARLMEIGKENEIVLIKSLIDHHVFIQNLTHKTNSFFMRTVALVFCCSLLTLSGSIFNAIQFSIISIDFLSMIAYCSCMLLQIFLYTLYGNKLIEKSQSVADAVYKSNWLNVDSAQRRELKFIMQICSKGTVMSYKGQCILNLNTFVWILKASYTALNLLRSGANA